MYDWHIVLGIIAGLIGFSSIFPYVKDILHGTTRPNIFTYAIWGLLSLISISAQISSGASWSLIFLFGDLLAVITVITLCLFGYGYKKYGRTEGVCTAIALVAIVAWQVTGNPLIAIFFSIIADLVASIPTIIKTFRDPQSEIPGPWFIVAFGALLGIISTTIFDLSNLLFPAYILMINGTVGAIAFFGRRLRQVSNESM